MLFGDMYGTRWIQLNTDLVVMPGGMTPQLHILDVFDNKPFKDSLSHFCWELLLSEKCLLTPAGKITKLSDALIENG
jgi:hypothetical protein